MEAKAWQAFYATLLLERSKFGLNELLGGARWEKKANQQEGHKAEVWSNLPYERDRFASNNSHRHCGMVKRRGAKYRPSDYCRATRPQISNVRRMRAVHLQDDVEAGRQEAVNKKRDHVAVELARSVFFPWPTIHLMRPPNT